MLLGDKMYICDIANEYYQTGRKPLVLLSGGLDSTFLVSTLLMSIPVDIMYVKSSQGPNKIEGELLSRENIRKYLDEGFTEGSYTFKIEQDFIVDIGNNRIADCKLSQPISWFYAAMLQYDHNKHSCVCIAYVTGDAICQSLHKLEQAWELISSITKKETIPLAFPLRDMRKHEILAIIDPELEKLTVVCEGPRVTEGSHIHQCGICNTCITSKLEKQRTAFLAKLNKPS